MSTLYTAVPLGDGSFTENGYSAVNEFGVQIAYLTDPCTGADPFRSSIPNPPLSPDLPDSWGMAAIPGAFVPQLPVCCTVVPDNPLPPDVVAEPWQAGLIAFALIAGGMRRRFA